MNKQGFFMVFLFFALLFTVGYAAFAVLTTSGEASKFFLEKQSRLIDLYGVGEKDLFYIDKSAEYSTYNSLRWLGDKGGFGFSGPECGSFEGNILWASKGKICYPNVRENFISVFKGFFGDYLLKSGFGIGTGDYDIVLDKNKVKGLAKKKIEVEEKVGDDKIKYSFYGHFIQTMPFDFGEYDGLIKKVDELLVCLGNKKKNSDDDIKECGFDLKYGRFDDVLVFHIDKGDLLGREFAIRFAVDVAGIEQAEVKGLFEE